MNKKKEASHKRRRLYNFYFLYILEHYSTVTDFARFLGLSTSKPLATLT